MDQKAKSSQSHIRGTGEYLLEVACTDWYQEKRETICEGRIKRKRYDLPVQDPLYGKVYRRVSRLERPNVYKGKVYGLSQGRVYNVSFDALLIPDQRYPWWANSDISDYIGRKPKAIKVEIKCLTVGYLIEDPYKDYTKKLKQADLMGQTAVCSAIIVGGGMVGLASRGFSKIPYRGYLDICTRPFNRKMYIVDF